MRRWSPLTFSSPNVIRILHLTGRLRHCINRTQRPEQNVWSEKLKNGAFGTAGPDVQGVFGEWAAAYMLGLKPLDVVQALDHPDDGTDMTVKGVTIQVKTVSDPDRRVLLHPNEHPPKSDRVILCWLTDVEDEPTVSFIGWADRDTWLEEMHKGDLGNGPVWILDNKHLSPFDDWDLYEDEQETTHGES